MYVVFYSTSSVFEAEERLKESGINCKVVPTPVTDKAYCGVCVETDSIELSNVLDGMEYSIVE